jgi:hypothetical protein
VPGDIMARVQTRRLLNLSMAIYCAGLFVTSVWPTENFGWARTIVAVTSVFALIGLLARAIPRVSLPRDDLAYLVTGFSGTFTLLVFEWTGPDDPWYIKLRIGLFLAVGVFACFGAHLTIEHDPIHGWVHRG